METKANHAIVGSFVLGLFGCAVGFLYWMMVGEGGHGRASYAILFDGSVAGLSTASDVLFNGIPVGRVRSLAINESDPRKVEVVIGLKPGTPVRVDSRASLVQIGITGLSAVQLSAGTPNAVLLAPAAEPPYRLIKADLAVQRGVMEAAPELLAQASSLFGRLNDLVASNEQAISRTIAHAEAFSAMLDANKGEVEAIVRDARSIAAQFRAAAVKLETTIDGVQGAFAAGNGSVIEDARKAAVAFRSVAEKLDSSVGENAEQVTRMAKRSLQEFELFMKDGRRAAQSLDRVLDRVERNPQSLIFGGAGVKEYKPVN